MLTLATDASLINCDLTDFAHDLCAEDHIHSDFTGSTCSDMIEIDHNDGVLLSSFDEADRTLIMMLALRLKNAKDVFYQAHNVVCWTDGQNEILRLRDENRGIECIHYVTEFCKSITLRKTTPLCEWVKTWADDALAECASYRIDVSSILYDANEDDVNVKVWIEHNFFAGALTYTSDGWICENYKLIVFATYNDAAEWVKSQLKKGYCGESYTICK